MLLAHHMDSSYSLKSFFSRFTLKSYFKSVTFAETSHKFIKNESPMVNFSFKQKPFIFFDTRESQQIML